MTQRRGGRLNIAIIGTGISGLSAAWLLSQAHDVVVYEQAARLGGHGHTVDVPSTAGTMPVDMGFIVYNPATYPNLAALFAHLGVPTQQSDMSFAVSLRHGALEYAATDLPGLFAQQRNLLRPRFWIMLRDLVRFYRQATRDAAAGVAQEVTLGDYLATHGYGDAFIRDHLLPMAAAIWSAAPEAMLEYPAAAFLRFCETHGLLRLTGRPEWRTVTGGSRAYIERLAAPFADRLRLNCGVRSITRRTEGVCLQDSQGGAAVYDHVVVAAHADQALRMLADPSDAETALLGPLRYRDNAAVMHRDPRLMPRRRRAWSSWNFVGGDAQKAGEQRAADDSTSEVPPVCASYWMNRLQNLPDVAPVFVTLNPYADPASATVLHRETYAHPQFDVPALQAQRALWSLQGVRRTWYCGAYFGAGFHEDGLQAGLAVAEALGGVRRPWTVPDESGRIFLPPPTPPLAMAA